MLVTSSTHKRPNEESHDGICTRTKEEEEKIIYTEGIIRIPNYDNNPTVRYEVARLEKR